MSEEVIAPIGKILTDLGKVRASAYNDLMKLPAADPMKKVLTDIDKLLGRTEEEIIKASTGVVRRRLWPLPSPREIDLPGLGKIREITTRFPGGGSVTMIGGPRR